MEKEEFLATHTFSDSGLTTVRRVFDTLTQDDRMASLRVAKMLGLLVQTLEASGVLTAEKIDDMLIEVI